MIARCYQHVIYSFIVTVRGDVIQKETGNPSGSFNTITDNTILLTVLLVYAFVRLVPLELDKLSFFSVVSAALYGDDNTFTVHDKYLSVFNCVSIAKVWTTELGVKVKLVCDVPRPLSELRFLSHGFKLAQGYVVATPSCDKLYCSMAYHTKRPDDKFLSFARLCSLYQEAFFTELKPLFKAYFKHLKQLHWTDVCASAKKYNVHDPGSMWLSDEEIFRQHTGTESAVALNFSRIKTLNGKKDEGWDYWFAQGETGDLC